MSLRRRSSYAWTGNWHYPPSMLFLHIQPYCPHTTTYTPSLHDLTATMDCLCITTLMEWNMLSVHCNCYPWYEIPHLHISFLVPACAPPSPLPVRCTTHTVTVTATATTTRLPPLLQVNEIQLLKCQADTGSFVLYFRGYPSATIPFNANQQAVTNAVLATPGRYTHTIRLTPVGFNSYHHCHVLIPSAVIYLYLCDTV